MNNNYKGGKTTEKAFYERLGGYNSIAGVVEDFIGRLVADEQPSRFFGSLQKLKKENVTTDCGYAVGSNMRSLI